MRCRVGGGGRVNGGGRGQGGLDRMGAPMSAKGEPCGAPPRRQKGLAAQG